MWEIIAQIIGIFAMAFNIWSYQQKQQKYIIAFQLLGTTFFSIHFFMLGAYMGGLLNAIGVVRAIVFLYKDKLKTDNIFWLSGFVGIYIICYVLVFTAFGKPFTFVNAIIELLPVIGMVATSLAYRSKTAKSTRLLGFVSSPSWLIYNIISLSIGAICCEALSLISITVGLLRLDKKTTNDSNQ